MGVLELRIGDGRCREGVLGVGVDELTGGVRVALENVGHAGETDDAGGADPQDRIYVVVVELAELDRPAGVDKDHDLLERACGPLVLEHGEKVLLIGVECELADAFSVLEHEVTVLGALTGNHDDGGVIVIGSPAGLEVISVERYRCLSDFGVLCILHAADAAVLVGLDHSGVDIEGRLHRREVGDLLHGAGVRGRVVAVEGSVGGSRGTESRRYLGVGVLDGVLAKERDACARGQRKGAVVVLEKDAAALHLLDARGYAVVLELLECFGVIDIITVVALVVNRVGV